MFAKLWEVVYGWPIGYKWDYTRWVGNDSGNIEEVKLYQVNEEEATDHT